MVKQKKVWYMFFLCAALGCTFRLKSSQGVISMAYGIFHFLVKPWQPQLCLWYMIYLPKIENNSVVKIFSFVLKMWVVFERWYFSINLFLWFCFKDEALVDWVNPMYLDTGVVKDIRARFKDESEIQLQEFLLVNLHLISTFVTFSLLTDWECQRVKYLVQFCELWVKLSNQPDLRQ